MKGALWYLVYAKDAEGWSYSVLTARENSIALSANRKVASIIVKAADRLGNVSK